MNAPSTEGNAAHQGAGPGTPLDRDHLEGAPRRVMAPGSGPARLRLGARCRILAFDVDADELEELLLSLRPMECVEVLEERWLHEALDRLAMRRIDWLLLDRRRSPPGVLARLANAVMAIGGTAVLPEDDGSAADAGPSCHDGSGPRVLCVAEALPRHAVRLQSWIDAHVGASNERDLTANGRARLQVTGRTGYGTARKGRVLS